MTRATITATQATVTVTSYTPVPSFTLIVQGREIRNGYYLAGINNQGQLQQFAQRDPNQATGFKNEATDLLLYANSGFAQGSHVYLRLEAGQKAAKPIGFTGSSSANDVDLVCNVGASAGFTCQFPTTGTPAFFALCEGNYWVVSQDADPGSIYAVDNCAHGYSIITLTAVPYTGPP